MASAPYFLDQTIAFNNQISSGSLLSIRGRLLKKEEYQFEKNQIFYISKLTLPFSCRSAPFPFGEQHHKTVCEVCLSLLTVDLPPSFSKRAIDGTFDVDSFVFN